MKEEEKKNSKKMMVLVGWLSVVALVLIVVILVLNIGIFKKNEKTDEDIKVMTQIGEFQRIEKDKFFYVDKSDLKEKNWNISDKTKFFEIDDGNKNELSGLEGMTKGRLVTAYFKKKLDLDNAYPESVVFEQTKFTGFVESFQDKVLTVAVDKLGNKLTEKFLVDDQTKIVVKNISSAESYPGNSDEIKNDILVSVKYKDLGKDRDNWAEEIEVILSGE